MRVFLSGRARTGDVEFQGGLVGVGAGQNGHDALADLVAEPVGCPGLPEAQVHARPVAPP